MKKKFAKAIAYTMCGILALSSPIQTLATESITHVEAGFSYGDYKNEALGVDGYGIVKADTTALSDGSGTLIIPDYVNGKKVLYLYENFMSKTGADKVEIGAEIIGMDDAFFEAKELREITSRNARFTTSTDDPALYNAATHNYLLDYPSAASDGGNYEVNEATKVIYSMDNASFDTLNLRNTDTMGKRVLCGTEANKIIMADNIRTSSSNGITTLTLPGLHAGEFVLTEAESGSYLQTDGQVLFTTDGRLIKISSEVTDGINWSQFSSIDNNAFDSMAQYWSLSESIPQYLKKDVVFHFYNQNNGVFILNDQIAFCYDSDKHIPDSVTDSADFSGIIDGANYDKVKAVMFVGVPYDGTGLFEEIFGVSYTDALQDVDMSRGGNAALNAVSSVIWELVDGKPSDIIDGIGSTSYFTSENIKSYVNALKEAADNAASYTFTPSFEIEGNTLTFREQSDGTYLSDVFKVNAADGNGIINDNYKIEMMLSGEGFGIQGTDSMTFTTGTELRLTSASLPEGTPLTFSYQKGILTYYTPGDPGSEQYLLVSGKETAETPIQYFFEIKPPVETLEISKRAVSGSEELQGASLILKDQSNTTIAEWISGTTSKTIAMPEDGTYTLTEITAPDGYEVAESITFIIESGKIISGSEFENQVIMYDAPKDKSILISKKDFTTSEELPGASLKITDDSGNIVAEWTSTETPYIIADMEDGEYTLTEVTAPNGYEIAESINFIVTDGVVENGPIVMYDKPESDSIKISKKDIVSGEELPGAKLQITNSENIIVEEWVSTDHPHVIVDLEDGEYTLTEITAPNGYEIAESVSFTITDGTIENGIVTMYDSPIQDSEKTLKVSKRDITNGNELPGATLIITAEDNSIVEEWISSTIPHEIVGLEDGSYTLTEITAPEGYKISESIKFNVENGNVTNGMIVMYDERIQPATPSEPTPSEPDRPEDGYFYISKRDAANSDELPGAKLKISNEEGDIVAAWTSSNTPHKVTDLPDGTYTLTEITAPNGYEIAESITFEVTDGKVDGTTVVMYDKRVENKTTNNDNGNNGSGSGGSHHHSSGSSDSSNGPGVTPVNNTTNSTAEITINEPVPGPINVLPKTDDVSPAFIVFLAAAITILGILADKKKFVFIK